MINNSESLSNLLGDETESNASSLLPLVIYKQKSTNNLTKTNKKFTGSNFDRLEEFKIEP